MSLLQLLAHCTITQPYVSSARIPGAMRQGAASMMEDFRAILYQRCVAVSSIKCIPSFKVRLRWVCFCFTRVHLGRSLDLDLLQLGEARRLCWNQIRRSDERRLPPTGVSIHLLWNLTSFVISIRLRSLTIPSEPPRNGGELR